MCVCSQEKQHVPHKTGQSYESQVAQNAAQKLVVDSTIFESTLFTFYNCTLCI